MPIMPGIHELGPENASLRVKTKRGGAAAKAGHDLLIEVTSWLGRLEVGDGLGQSSLTLSAESGSMEVIKGAGGVMALTDEDKVEVKKTLEAEVLQPGRVEFKSTQVTPTDDGQRLKVTGELSLNGNVHPLDFELEFGPNGAVSARATVKQSTWDIEPYSGLFGTLKVRDEVEVLGRHAQGARRGAGPRERSAAGRRLRETHAGAAPPRGRRRTGRSRSRTRGYGRPSAPSISGTS